MMTLLSLGISACRKAPGTSHIAVSLPYIVSIMILVIAVSVETVGDDIVSPYLRYLVFLLTFSQVDTFLFPHRLSLISFNESKSIFLSSGVKSLGYIYPKTDFPGIGNSFYYLYSLNMASITFLQIFLFQPLY